jgi:hypothetical protein
MMPGPFHRLETSLQSSTDAVLQHQSMEIWGREPYGSSFLVVQAYRGPLPTGERGVEFDTDIPPERGSGGPREARWYFPNTPRVMLRSRNGEDFACISVSRFVNRQP